MVIKHETIIEYFWKTFFFFKYTGILKMIYINIYIVYDSVKSFRSINVHSTLKLFRSSIYISAKIMADKYFSFNKDIY